MSENTVSQSTITDRLLLTEVSRWRKANGWTDSWRGWIDEASVEDARVAVEVEGEVGTGAFRVTWRKANGGWQEPRYYDAVDVQQAVDQLVALRILPDRFASAYRAGVASCQPTIRRLVKAAMFGGAR